jgi:hypothetical protein
MASILPLGGIGVFAVDEWGSVPLCLFHSVFPCNLILSFEGWGLLHSGRSYPLTRTRCDNVPPTKPRSLEDCSDKAKKPQGRPLGLQLLLSSLQLTGYNTGGDSRGQRSPIVVPVSYTEHQPSCRKAQWKTRSRLEGHTSVVCDKLKAKQVRVKWPCPFCDPVIQYITQLTF